MLTVGIVDYGLGNVASVAGAVTKIGAEPLITGDPEALRRADRLILPGVGAFGDGMSNLRKRGLDQSLREIVVEEGKPLLGICLGAQLLARTSSEFGLHDGLGWIDATVEHLQPADGGRVPHVGWNSLIQVADSPLFQGIADGSLFYYVHSLHIRAAADVVCGECDYGGRFTSVVQRDNVFGVQFHPEKSQLPGLQLIRNFLGLD